MEKEMATHSSILAWKIPWTEEPARLQSMGSQRVRHNWMTSLSLFTFMHWRRKWQPTPVFLPRESQGRGSPVRCRLWGRRVGHDWSDLAVAAALSCCDFGNRIMMPSHNELGIFLLFNFFGQAWEGLTLILLQYLIEFSETIWLVLGFSLLGRCGDWFSYLTHYWYVHISYFF